MKHPSAGPTVAMLAFVALLALLASHGVGAQVAASDNAPCPKDWRYGDQRAWCGVCVTGRVQTPIAIPADLPPSPALTPIRLGYHEFSLHPAFKTGNGQYYEFEVPESAHSTFTANEKTYTLKQFHFHFPAENQVADAAGNTRQYAGEMHLVHASSAGKPAAVIAIFIDKTSDTSLARRFAPIAEAARMRDSASWRWPDFDLSGFIQRQAAYTLFPGSLTTPPCTQGIAWYVLSAPVFATDAQIAAIFAGIPNARTPLLPPNGRSIRRYAPPAARADKPAAAAKKP